MSEVSTTPLCKVLTNSHILYLKVVKLKGSYVWSDSFILRELHFQEKIASKLSVKVSSIVMAHLQLTKHIQLDLCL